MEHYVSKVNYADKRKSLEREEELSDNLESIAFDCQFSVEVIGIKWIRVWFYPLDGKDEFTKEEANKLMTLLRVHFGFKNTVPPKDTPNHAKDSFHWERNFRETDGSFYMKRTVEHAFTDPDGEIWFMIENSSKNGCRLIQKEKTVKYFEADCSEK